ncbi:MAG: M14 family zinc carboxypeptidase [Gemmatimonadetes bacterium]|nr:M14 family zinc carboxypeptidase [Gemmatimonadota bacterium]
MIRTLTPLAVLVCAGCAASGATPRSEGGAPATATTGALGPATTTTATSRPTSDPARTTALTTAEELIGLYDGVRVPGLDDRRFNHETYWRSVEPYLGGSVASVTVGESAEGRTIRQLTFGSGPTTVLLWSQMHGNESTASMSLADIVRFFHEHGDHPAVRRIAQGATVHMIPMLNPDGAERFQRRNAQGIDVNRDARMLQTPEGRTLKGVTDALTPDFGFNLHDQGAAVRVGQTNRGVAIALLAPAFNEARDVDAKRRRAMQVASLLIGAMEPLVGGHIAKYDDTFNPRAFGDLMGQWGASTILIESGAWADDPQKQHLRKTNFVGILTALDAVATGSYAAFDPDVYESLAYNGRRVPDLLISGGTIAVPGIPVLKADILLNYDRPLMHEAGVITDIGDMGETEAQDTLDVRGLYLIPTARALDASGGLDAGAPAHFIVAEDREGLRVRFRFEGGPARREE